jgi:ribosomal protein L18E
MRILISQLKLEIYLSNIQKLCYYLTVNTTCLHYRDQPSYVWGYNHRLLCKIQGTDKYSVGAEYRASDAKAAGTHSMQIISLTVTNMHHSAYIAKLKYLGMTLANQTSIHKEVMSRFSSRKVSYHSVKIFKRFKSPGILHCVTGYLLSSHLLSKNLQIQNYPNQTSSGCDNRVSHSTGKMWTELF